MILRYPAYYEDFHCIADRCEDTCCAGWEIDIDDRSYLRYMAVDGEFGERLRGNIKEYEADDEDVYERHGFVLGGDRRCPFLRDDNLCELYRELGEEALCDVCANTPRVILEYGGERELSVSASCPEAGRLIYGGRGPVTFVEREISEKLDFEESEEEMALARGIRAARDVCIRILQDRSRPLVERFVRFLRYAQSVQECLNNNAPESIRRDWDEPVERGVESTDAILKNTLFLRRMATFTSMECINERWREMLELMQKHLIETGEYARRTEEFVRYIRERDREYEYEHLLVYYVFLCAGRSVDDYDFIGRAKLAAAGFLMIRDMDAAWFFENGGSFDKEARLMTTRIYAKEVEHSEENLAYLADEFLFEEAYSIENLCKSV